MDKKTIKEQLLEHHHTFVGFISGLSDTQYITSANEKWAAGQQLEHIYLSVRPVRLALSLPKFILKIFWGRANRKSRSYDELVKKYFRQ